MDNELIAVIVAAPLGLDFRYIYTTINGVLGTTADTLDKLNFYG